MIDFALTCRTCMKTNDNLVHLTELSQIDENTTVQIIELLMECTSLNVLEGDSLPQNLCRECLKTLHVSFTFRHQAAKSEEEFKKLLRDDIKVEVKDESNYDFELELNNFDLQNDFDSISNLKNEPVEPFNCTKCNKTFNKEKKYLKHLESHTELYCSICNETFHKKSTYKKHILKHNLECENVGDDIYGDENLSDDKIDDNFKIDVKNENLNEQRYECSNCDMWFTKSRSLAVHMKKHERKESVAESCICDTCGKEFLSKPLLKRHLKLHEDVKPYKCVKCSKSYSRADQFKVHMNTHNDKKPNVCPYCNKAFTQVCSLKDHIRTHTGETPYLCSECGKGFANSSNLRQHMMRHTGLKPYACKLCPKTFATKGQMKNHMATHTGEHPFKCDTCCAAFTKHSSLKKHARIHTGDRPYACETCLMRFTCKDHLKRHYRIHTGEKPYKCRYCERAFTQSNDLVKHMRSHLGQNIYDCTVCGLRFRLKSELNKHYPIHFSEEQAAKLLEMDPDKTSQDIVKISESHTQTNDIKQTKDIETYMITINGNNDNGIVTINVDLGGNQ